MSKRGLFQFEHCKNFLMFPKTMSTKRHFWVGNASLNQGHLLVSEISDDKTTSLGIVGFITFL